MRHRVPIGLLGLLALAELPASELVVEPIPRKDEPRRPVVVSRPFPVPPPDDEVVSRQVRRARERAARKASRRTRG